MATRVYGWEDNPSVDRFRFKLSDKNAAEIVDSKRGEYITLPNGHRAVQMFYSAPRESALSAFEKIAQNSGGNLPHEIAGVYFEEPKSSPRYWWQLRMKLTA